MKNSNKLVAAAVGAVAVIAIAWLAFGYFGIQSAFVDDEVDEAGPIFDATPAEQDEMAATEEFQDAMAEAEQNRTGVDEDMPPMDDDAGTDEAEPEIVTEASGAFSGTSRYDVTGEAAVLGNGTGQRFLRFEDFESSNGPDLKVYLRADDGSFVSLGELKGNIGSQNYEIPADVDLSTYDSVQIWCERFGVEFGFADLA
ncbi:MAG: DM13 domain-containing protein [Acidimicrobiales bacterium]